MRPAPPRVILRHCDSYDPARIRAIVREGMEELGLRPVGRTLVKPNLVMAGPMFEHAFTRPEFTEGVLGALSDRADGRMTELAVGERCGITIPTRFVFEQSGYDPMLKRLGVRRYCFEEEPQVEIPLTHPQRLRDYLYTPEPIARADFFVNCPKFKAHPWTTVTFSLKAYIGIQDDRHRLIDHDHRLDEKIADLQHILQPQLIAIDAITAGEGRMLTPLPYTLNLIVMGTNQVAVDAVCCRIIGVEPDTVAHVRLSHEHGFGPLAMDAIEITGDVSFEEARARAAKFRVGLIRVEEYFKGTNIHAYAGPPPEPERSDYCWGGCPGAIEEAIEILRRFDAECDGKIPPMHVVFGAYDGPIDAKPGEKVLFIGDCATFDGEIAGKPVQIRSKYQDRSTRDPHRATSDDILVKMWKSMRQFQKDGDQQVIRLSGCPVSVAEQVLAIVALSDVKNPYFDTATIVDVNKAYLAYRARTLLGRLRGRAYQQPGPTERGQARVE